MQRIRVFLDDAEYEALCRLSDLELRPLPDQVRAVLRERLWQMGLLPNGKAVKGDAPCTS